MSFEQTSLFGVVEDINENVDKKDEVNKAVEECQAGEKPEGTSKEVAVKTETKTPAKTEKVFEPKKPPVVAYATHQIPVPDSILADAKGKPEKEALEMIRKWLAKKFIEFREKSKVIMDYNEKTGLICPMRKAGTKGCLVGIFSSFSSMKEDPKPINYVMARDGIYEVRHTGVGFFARKVEKVDELEEIKEGFYPALPKIPGKFLLEIIEEFKKAQPQEKLALVLWDPETQQYSVEFPEQKTSEVSIHFDRQSLKNKIVAIELHSHPGNYCDFSPVDNEDEVATGLYGVVASLQDKPKIKLRMSVNGYFKPVTLKEVFEVGE